MAATTFSGRLYDRLIMRPVQRFYLNPIADQIANLSESEQRAVLDQAVIGWLQTILLVVAIIQALFAGVLAALPQELRAALGFLHRIEWAVYAGMLLVGAQAARGYAYHLILTNRFYALGWRFSKMRIVRDRRVRTLTSVYAIVIILMAIAVLYVRANGFIFQATQQTVQQTIQP
jgi:hypothetical protein